MLSGHVSVGFVAVLLTAEWQASQQQPAGPFPIEADPQRKRCRQDDRLHDNKPPPPSAVASSARDPQAPSVSVVVPAATDVKQPAAEVVTHSGNDCVSEVLPTNLASQCRSGALATTGWDDLSAPLTGGSKVVAVLVAAKQAAAVMKRHAFRQEQDRANAAAQQAQQMHRYVVS